MLNYQRVYPECSQQDQFVGETGSSGVQTSHPEGFCSTVPWRAVLLFWRRRQRLKRHQNNSEDSLELVDLVACSEYCGKPNATNHPQWHQKLVGLKPYPNLPVDCIGLPTLVTSPVEKMMRLALWLVFELGIAWHRLAYGESMLAERATWSDNLTIALL